MSESTFLMQTSCNKIVILLKQYVFLVSYSCAPTFIVIFNYAKPSLWSFGGPKGTYDLAIIYKLKEKRRK